MCVCVYIYIYIHTHIYLGMCVYIVAFYDKYSQFHKLSSKMLICYESSYDTAYKCM